MSDTPTKIIVDCSTNQAVEVPLTPEEIAQKEIDAIQIAKHDAEKKAEIEAIQLAKQSAEAKLSALGLTAEEIAALTK
jgi:hypothetical protein